MQINQRIEHLKLEADQSFSKTLSDDEWAQQAAVLLNKHFCDFKMDPSSFLQENFNRQIEWGSTFPSLSFSHHPMTLISTDLYHLDLYFWLPGDTLPHDHGFHGAFMPLFGEYVQTHYQFKTTQDLGEGVVEGELIEGREELMPLNQAYPIFHAPKFIHSVRHDSFCVTLVLRSLNTGEVISDYYPTLKISNHFKETQIARESWQKLNLLAYLTPEKVESIFKTQTRARLLRWLHLEENNSSLKKRLALFLN